MTLDKFTRAYIEAALWSSTDPESGVPLDESYGVDDIAPEALEAMAEDAAEFLDEHWDDVKGDPERAGIDFWLTRNGHGSGFWDGGWGEAGDRLTEAAKAYGEMYLMVGDDGLVHTLSSERPPKVTWRKRWRPRR